MTNCADPDQLASSKDGHVVFSKRRVKRVYSYAKGESPDHVHICAV